MIINFLLLVLAVSEATSAAPDYKVTKLAQANNDLAFDLMKFYKNEKNVFISPFSISTALGLVYLGTDGNTTKLMSDVLKYNKHGLAQFEVHEAFQTVLKNLKDQVEGYELSSSNNVFVQKDFIILHMYGHAVRLYYSADIESVDFSKGPQIQSRINSIVENATRGKIKDFLTQPPSSDAKLFLLNAVYFQGNWLSPFNPDVTSKRPFHNNGVNEKQVDTMFRDGQYKVSRSQELSAQMIVLPYKGNNTASMIIVLPDQKDGVAELQEKLDKVAFDKLLNSTYSRRVALSMPKFNLTYSAELGDAFKHLGLGELFGNRANFFRLVGEQKLKLSSVNHKAVLEVDEKGSKAAAATGIEIMVTSMPPRIAIDHPFLFFIRDDKTGLILFSGRVNEL